MNRTSPPARLALALALAAAALAPLPAPGRAQAPPAERSALQERADRFLELVNASTQAISTVEQEALWDAATDVTPAHDAAAEAASRSRAAFTGNPALIGEARALLERRAELAPLAVRQLERVLLNAAEGPMTDPELVRARIEAETRQLSTMNAFAFTLDGRPITPNQMDERLETLTDLDARRAVWEASKQSGPALRAGLAELQGLRNRVARELGYPDYFALKVAGHDLTTDEMVRMNEEFLRVLEPLYRQLHTWVKHELARRYGQPVPGRIPAHWIPNRWSQEWNALVASASLDAAFESRDPEWVVRTAEGFWLSLGLEPIPGSFWVKSDLYPVPAGETRRKNSHAYSWHMDLERDIRSLMSVEANERWFGTAHHELGHGHYSLCTVRPEVPPLLRNGASPSFDEAMATLGELAAQQAGYLESLGLQPERRRRDEITPLLRQALADIPFMFWAAGVMTHWEADLYARGMPPGEWNARWWRYVGDYQGVEPPAPRGEEFCDAATKTHVNDFPAYYYSYAVAKVITYQLNDHIARRILEADPRHCTYAGNREVGAFLAGMMRKGATEDWRTVLRAATGEELSTRAMVEYYRPLMKWLERENRGRTIGWD